MLPPSPTHTRSPIVPKPLAPRFPASSHPGGYRTDNWSVSDRGFTRELFHFVSPAPPAVGKIPQTRAKITVVQFAQCSYDRVLLLISYMVRRIRNGQYGAPYASKCTRKVSGFRYVLDSGWTCKIPDLRAITKKKKKKLFMREYKKQKPKKNFLFVKNKTRTTFSCSSLRHIFTIPYTNTKQLQSAHVSSGFIIFEMINRIYFCRYILLCRYNIYTDFSFLLSNSVHINRFMLKSFYFSFILDKD